MKTHREYQLAKQKIKKKKFHETKQFNSVRLFLFFFLLHHNLIDLIDQDNQTIDLVHHASA